MVDLKIFLNEIQTEIEENCTAYKLRNKVDKNCDVLILNGFPLKEDKIFKEDDIRGIVKKAKDEDKSIYEKLNEIGYIKKLDDLLQEVYINDIFLSLYV